ncbi:hypothetical protein CDAR_564441 [Caerostris darwini]|uniref:Uncharacterized protein n=1 Tax=Caerostris darwini TaxID=1538125 RepID=A0AAV4TJY4_9ARAC|nr:hypothetical protein CDAR_564441 [Caerostris darwini]
MAAASPPFAGGLPRMQMSISPLSLFTSFRSERGWSIQWAFHACDASFLGWSHANLTWPRSRVLQFLLIPFSLPPFPVRIFRQPPFLFYPPSYASVIVVYGWEKECEGLE